jgi:hypothetical protein
MPDHPKSLFTMLRLIFPLVTVQPLLPDHQIQQLMAKATLVPPLEALI